MATWSDVSAEAPDLAATVQARFTERKHHTLATLRADGSPRISGTEVAFDSSDLQLGSMAGAVKARDLQRDARFALHSATIDPPEDDPSAWPGEAKIAGRVIEEPPGEDGSHRFRIDVREVVLTRITPEGDALEITSWHEGRGIDVRRRT